MFDWELEQWYQYHHGSKRAFGMKQRLKKEKILIILDDIWKAVDLEEIGIPSCKYDDDDDENHCKIIMTSNYGELLSKDMGAQICFPVDALPQEEACSLFNKTADKWVEEGNNPEMRSIATRVVKRCQGLPIAIVTTAKALKHETLPDIWMNALEQLIRFRNRNNSAAAGAGAGKNMMQQVIYSSCLEWSYTHLKGDDLKSLFLLCGMLGYGDIPLYHMLQYAMGLGFLDRFGSLEQARNRLLELVQVLKASSRLLEDHEYRPNFERSSSSLLFTDPYNKFVRMHDVVCNVAKEIASRDPQGLVRSKLQFFPLRNNYFSQGMMTKLQVLDLSRMDFRRLPPSLDSLANLRTLRLDWCSSLVDIDAAFIGRLRKLQVLSLVGSAIQRLPKEIVRLSNLMLLDLNYCSKLEVIPPNILSSLSQLECLCMMNSFTRWAVVEGDNSAYACLSELNNLSRLTTLSIAIPDATLLPKDIQFEKLNRYAIFIGGSSGCFKTKRTLTLNKFHRSLDLGDDGISKLLERSEELEFMALSGSNYVLRPSDEKSFLELKHLRVFTALKLSISLIRWIKLVHFLYWSHWNLGV